MVGFDYKYTSVSDILKSINLISDYSNTQFIFLFLSIILLFSSIYYIIPYINIYFLFLKKENAKKTKKEMIKQIVLQKTINDEIEKELNI